MCVEGDFDGHELWVDDVDPVSVAKPHLGVDLHHAPDAVMGLAQVEQVVVLQVPLSVRRPMKDRHRSVRQSSQNSTLHVDDGEDGVLEADGVDASTPLRDGRVDVDGAGLGAEPHGGQHRGHLLHLGVGNLVLL